MACTKTYPKTSIHVTQGRKPNEPIASRTSFPTTCSQALLLHLRLVLQLIAHQGPPRGGHRHVEDLQLLGLQLFVAQQGSARPWGSPRRATRASARPTHCSGSRGFWNSKVSGGFFSSPHFAEIKALKGTSWRIWKPSAAPLGRSKAGRCFKRCVRTWI